MTVHKISTIQEFEETLANNEVVILDAFAEWCGPCHAISPSLSKWSEDEKFKDKIHFAKFDVDALPQLAQQLHIRAMPTFTFFKDGEKADEFIGANPPALLKLLAKHTPVEKEEAKEEQQ